MEETWVYLNNKWLCKRNEIRPITSDDHDHASFVSTTDVATPLSLIKNMKVLPLIYIGIIFLIACKPSKNDDVMVIDKNISTNEYKIDTIKFLENRFPIFLSGNNYTFVSDTIIQLNYKFIAFGKLGKIDFTSHYLRYFLDSIYVIDPFESKLKFNDCIHGFLYFDKNEFNTGTFSIIDINKDGKNDFAVYNDCLSGNGQNSTYDHWINDTLTLRLDTKFSLPNLGYNNMNKEYYSRSSAGGGDITETYYKLKSGKLKALRSLETEYIDGEHLKYTKINFIKNDTIIEIKKYIR